MYLLEEILDNEERYGPTYQKLASIWCKKINTNLLSKMALKKELELSNNDIGFIDDEDEMWCFTTEWKPIGAGVSPVEGPYRNKSWIEISVNFPIFQGKLELWIMDLHSYPKGYGGILIEALLSEWPTEWEIHIDHDVNNEFWKHIKEKYSQFYWTKS